jgi:hypothetical protein
MEIIHCMAGFLFKTVGIAALLVNILLFFSCKEGFDGHFLPASGRSSTPETSATSTETPTAAAATKSTSANTSSP